MFWLLRQWLVLACTFSEVMLATSSRAAPLPAPSSKASHAIRPHALEAQAIGFGKIRSPSVPPTAVQSLQEGKEDPFNSTCMPIHAQTHGINLVCCGGNSSSSSELPHDCEYAQQCLLQDECSCSLTLTARLNCTMESQPAAHEWADHSASKSALECHRPNLPGNDTRTAYSIRVERWNENTTAPFLQSLCSLNVSSLSFHDAGPLLSIWDLTKCFPRLLDLEISLHKETRLAAEQLFRSLRWLRSLRMVNADFALWHSVSPWIGSIGYLHIENSSLRELPMWLASAKQLKRVYVQGTDLRSAETISHMKQLTSAKLAWNYIGNLTAITFYTPGIFDIDLSHNNISSFSSSTFSKCAELRVLDLSHNPLVALPAGAFIGSGRLKWLKLDHTCIKTLLPEHLTGLAHLRTLSLSHTPLRNIAAFSLVPLKSLRVLNLNACNLTEIPTAVTQLCHLTHLNLADNYLHTSDSVAAEVLVHLSGLSQLDLSGNPLKEFPSGLLVLSPLNARLLRDTIRTLTLLPVWTADPCTPYYFNMHLGNRRDLTSAALRHLVLPWNMRRMKAEGLGYCRDQFQDYASNLDVYRDIERSSGCAVSRRLRSSPECMEKEKPPPTSRLHPLMRSRTTAASINRHAKNQPSPSSPLSSSCAQLVDSSHTPLLFLSAALNIVFLGGCMGIVCLCCAAGRRDRGQPILEG